MKKVVLLLAMLLLAGACAHAQFTPVYSTDNPAPSVTANTPVDLDYIKPMPVEDAYQVLVNAVGGRDPLGWRFKGNLGKTMMPGAKFFGVAFKNAAEMILAAAGLMPPVEGDDLITTKRVVPLSDDFKYVYPISNSGTGPLAGYYPVMGSYKNKDGAWKYVINTRAVMDSKVISWLLDLAGYGYCMETPPANPDGTIGNRGLTIRLVDVTLSEAMDSICAALNKSYKLKGTFYTIIDEFVPCCCKKAD